ncbi:hypothetical protein N7509_012435 [Penicillium cosmopolitanum]|uniref:EF-hand domain-containing protein n=1 Tax=Penicillium cosmopolitanum TaxID=1131564 RepID=A0A9W9VH82_9EURO|nr:uncharacterized protein N7509_012435 [Penicillium cosmopolitanum]KAJ5379316.1 hypothetical protein N7509_012435 [Penicillium cosmopolitanum]
MFFAAGLLLISHLVAVSLADCCDAHFDFTDGKWICADGTVATPAVEKAHVMPSAAIASVDADGSGDVDLGEYIAWLNDNVGQDHPVSPSFYQTYIDYFYSFDTNGNKKLDLGEAQGAT